MIVLLNVVLIFAKLPLLWRVEKMLREIREARKERERFARVEISLSSTESTEENLQLFNYGSCRWLIAFSVRGS